MLASYGLARDKIQPAKNEVKHPISIHLLGLSVKHDRSFAVGSLVSSGL